ncbi:MAG: hypothetical protein ABIQ11_07245 [Saprospiraceae bacterium]
MIKRKNISYFLLLGVLSIGCSLNDPGPQDPLNGFTLQVQNNYSLNSLSWNPVKVTGFKEYIILQSSSDIPPSPEPVISAETRVMKRIDDADITTFLSSDILFTPRVCYKIYAAVDDRFIQSGSVCVNQDIKIFGGFNDRANHAKGLDEMLMYDRVNGHFSIFDYKTGTVTTKVSDIIFSFPVIELSTVSDVTNAFVYDQSPPRLQKYSFPGMEPQAFKDFFGVLFAVSIYDQFLFAAVEETGKGFQVLRRSNMSNIDSEAGLFGNRAIGIFPGDPLIVIEAGDNGMNRYSIDANGKSTLLESKTIGISQPSLQSMSANTSQYFITGRLGSIINRDGVIVANLNNNQNEFVLMTRLADDEQKVAFISNDNVSQKLTIADISAIPVISKLLTFNLPSANYADLIIDDGIIYVMGVSFATGNAETFLLKFPMPE